ncbi:MAG: hypothetical protein AB1813_17545, partial [Verrucomicrobiota bacterium]
MEQSIRRRELPTERPRSNHVFLPAKKTLLLPDLNFSEATARFACVDEDHPQSGSFYRVEMDGVDHPSSGIRRRS